MKKTLLFFLFSVGAFAQTPDSNFGANGIAYRTISNTELHNNLNDGVLQPDGKIIYVGESLNPGINSMCFIARYNPDGSPDLSFSHTGLLVKQNTSYHQSIILQNDGKILVSGFNIISRYLPNGDPDTSFNTTGRLSMLTNDGLHTFYCRQIGLQDDGKIIASGNLASGGNTYFGIIRVNSNGSMDTTFGTNGIVRIPVVVSNSNVYSHKIQPDGKVVVFGEAHNGTDYDFALVRLNTNGTLDSTFGTNGKVITAFDPGNDYGRSGELLPDGKILLFGAASGKFALARYLPNGTPDTSFGVNGKVVLNHDLTLTMNSSVIRIPKLKRLANGKLLLSGTSNGDYKVIKLESNGNYDTSFGQNGFVTFDQGNDVPTVLLEKPDGTIVMAGSSNTVGKSDAKVKQIVLDANGTNGTISTKVIHPSYDRAVMSVLKISDGSVFTLSKSNINNSGKLILSKSFANGNPDTTFGTNGYLDLGAPNMWYDDNNHRMVLLPDATLLIAANFTELYKVNQNGTIDTTFGNNGVLDLAEYYNGITYIDRFIASNDNKILVITDYTLPSNSEQTAVLKLNLNGTLDTTFGSNGKVNYGFGTTFDLMYEFPNAIVQDASGKITITSVSRVQGTSVNNKVCFARLNPNGSFDTTFGTNGKYIYQHPYDIAPAGGIYLTPANDLLVPVYLSPVPNQFDYGTLKVTANGNVDTSFGTNGVLYDNAGWCMAVRSNGKFLKANNANGGYKIIQFHPNGAVDAAFGVNGVLEPPAGTTDYENYLASLLLLPEDKLLISGFSFNGERTRLMLVKYASLNLGLVDLSEKQNTVLVYPNPIESEAKLEYTLATAETISITLYDLQGKTVKQLMTNQVQQAGKQTVTFALDTTISAGQYVLVLSSAKGKQSIQILKK